MNDVIFDVVKLLIISSVVSRMLVIIGIFLNLFLDIVKLVIRVLCNVNGGLERDEIFLLELDVFFEV